MFIANYTPDDIDWMHIGVPGTIKTGEMPEFDDKRGNHILTKWGARGLIRMRFGDNVEEAKKRAMKQYRKFWEWQIQTFNQDNELRKAENRPYVRPTEELEEHAEKLGIDLIAPWTMKKNTAGSAALERNIELETQVATLSKQVESLMKTLEKHSGEVPFDLLPADQKMAKVDEAVKEGKTKPAEPEKAPEKTEAAEGEIGFESEDLKVYTNQFKGLGKKKLAEYVFSNADDLDSWPDEAKVALRDEWYKVYGKKEDFPIPA